MPRRAVRLLSFAVLALSGSLLGSPAGATATRPTNAMQLFEAGLLVEVNGLRREHGLVPLRLSPKLSLAARQHSTEMAERGYFSHSSAVRR